MIPTREDLAKIAIELYNLNRGGNDVVNNSVEGIEADFQDCPGHPSSARWGIYSQTRFPGPKNDLGHVWANDVKAVWLQRQGVKNLENRVKILEAMVSALVAVNHP